MPTTRLLGASKRWCCFSAVIPCPLRTVALLTQSYPAELGVTLSYNLGSRDFHFERLGGRSPRWRRTVAHRAPRCAGRLRQEPSITKNCCTSSSKCGSYLQIAKSSAPRVLESANFRHFCVELSWKGLVTAMVFMTLLNVKGTRQSRRNGMARSATPDSGSRPEAQRKWVHSQKMNTRATQLGHTRSCRGTGHVQPPSWEYCCSESASCRITTRPFCRNNEEL